MAGTLSFLWGMSPGLFDRRILHKKSVEKGEFEMIGF